VLIAQALVLRYRNTMNARVSRLSDEALEAIRAYPWPGNVRELENRIKRAVIMAKTPMIQPSDLELPWEGRAKPALTLKEARSHLERELIHRALLSHNWNISRAAEDLGISRQTLHEIMHKYAIKKPGAAAIGRKAVP
jgi:two-component system, NtrC family, response regulator